MEKVVLKYKIGDFEGPLDLLLHLINKNKLNILDVSISFLLEQYMSQINDFINNDMEIASEFLEMAARLLQIKSRTLLPIHELESDEVELLLHELIEYQIFKDMAEGLKEKYIGTDIFTREDLSDYSNLEDKKYQLKHDIDVLVQAFKLAITGIVTEINDDTDKFSEIVVKPIVSVSSKIITILRKKYECTEMHLINLFNDCNTKSDLVATFLAILELLKSNRLNLKEDKLLFVDR